MTTEENNELLKKINFNKTVDGLVPAVIQDAVDDRVLMLAYMNRESLHKTIETGETWFYSRSRRKLWNKGETSGNKQYVEKIFFDCDADALLIKVTQKGVACHKGYRSCFHNCFMRGGVEVDDCRDEGPILPTILTELFRIIKNRQRERPKGSYTAYLFEAGQDKILKKVGEEAAEVLIASKNNSEEELVYEMGDLWYHCLVLLAEHELTPEAVGRELRNRRLK